MIARAAAMLVVSLVAAACSTSTSTAAPTAAVADAKPGDPVGQQFPDQGNDHIATGQRFTTYNSFPPTSGPHWVDPQPWGFYTTAIADETLVHNLEHGGIVISHNAAPDIVERLKALRATYKPDKFGSVKLVVRPYARLEPGTIALAAWMWLDVLKSYDELRVRNFIAAHYGQCCEDVP